MKMEKIKGFAEAAARAHGIWVKTSIIDGPFTGKKSGLVRFYQTVCYAPEDSPHAPAAIENRRLIGISRGDAKRLYASRIGHPSGQSYMDLQEASKQFTATGDTPEECAEILARIARSGAFRDAAHAVADKAARIELEMRATLRRDIAGLAGKDLDEIEELMGRRIR